MPDTYTKEQVDEAKYQCEWFVRDHNHCDHFMSLSIKIILSALSTTEQERDALAARCAELEARMQDGTLSDGYHSFNELYEYRMLYNAALFNEWASLGKYNVHKSTRHSDGQECFGGGWFIVVAILPTGQITNHYKLEYWDVFKIPESNQALFEYDGHTPRDVADRLRAAILGEKKE